VPKKKLTPSQIQAIPKLYEEEKLSSQQIAKKFGVYDNTIRVHLKKAGVKFRSKSEAGKRKDFPDIEEIRKKYEVDGISTYKLGKEYGIPSTTIYVRLKNAGVKMRNREDAEKNFIDKLGSNPVSRVARSDLTTESIIKPFSEDPSDKENVTNIKEYSIDRIVFLEQFELFKEKILANTSPKESFINFQTGLPKEWEFYKLYIYYEAQKRLDVKSWRAEDVGTGKKLKNVISAIEINDPEHREGNESLRNNLLVWDSRYGQDANDHRSLLDALHDVSKITAFEGLLYRFYKDQIEMKAAFESFVALAGKRYSFIAYLFFIKNLNNYLPISPSNFDKAFQMLKIPLKTKQNCSWENYQSYIGVIRQIRSCLIEVGIDNAQLLDAHSFCWMLVRLPLPENIDTRVNIPIPEPLSIDILRPKKEIGGLKNGDKDSVTETDYDQRNKNNAALGKLAETIVLRAEQKRLRKVGRTDLAERVDPDYSKDPKYGYDILSYDDDGSQRYIEVKSVQVIGDYYSFIISDYEVERSKCTENYFLYFVEKARSRNPIIRYIPSKDLKQEYLHPLNYRAFVPILKIDR